MRRTTKIDLAVSLPILFASVVLVVFILLPLGGPARGSITTNGTPLYVGCENAPDVQGWGWADGEVARLHWIDPPNGTQAYTEYLISGNGFFGPAPYITPLASMSSYTLVAEVTGEHNVSISVQVEALPTGLACP